MNLISFPRGKHPQPHNNIIFKPSTYKPPAYKPAEESEAGLSKAGLSQPRHRGSRQPPQGPAWPWGNYLLDVGGLSSVSTIADLGRDSLIYTGGTASLYRTLPNVGWPEQTGHTIHFTYEITHLSFLGYTKQSIYVSNTSLIP